MGQSQGQGLALGQLLPPSSSSSPVILVKSEQRLDGAAPPTPDSVESLTTKLDDAVKPAGWDSPESSAEAVQSPTAELEHKSDGDGICWGERRWEVKPTGWADEQRSDQEVKPTGWEDGVRTDQDVKPTGLRSDQDVKPTGWEDGVRTDQDLKPRSDQDVKPTGWEDGVRSDQVVRPSGLGDGVRSDQDVTPSGWGDGVRSDQDVKPRSDQDVKPTGWEDEVRSDQDVKPSGWEDEVRSDQVVTPIGWGWGDGVRFDQDETHSGWEDGVRSDQDVTPTGWGDGVRSDHVNHTGWGDGVRSDQDVTPTGWEDEVRSQAVPSDVNCEKVKYPERPGRPDCSFYVATGSCKYGLNCRYNHPSQRSKGYKGKSKKGSESTKIGVCKVPTVVNTEERVLDLSASAEAYKQSKNPKQMEKQEGKSEGNGCHDYPRPEGDSNPVELIPSKEGKSEAIGFRRRADKPDCSYYLKGNCQFGSNCKFNHPSKGKVTTKNQSEHIKSSVSRGNKVGTTGKHTHLPVKTQPGPEELNFLGLPMRPGEMECTHFMRTGSCKFATNCRYHHPNPVAVTEQDSLSGYQNGVSPQQHASGASELPMTSFPLPIASCGPLPHPSSPYTPGFYALPTEGFYPYPGWNGYQVPTAPWAPPEMISASSMSNGHVPTHQAPQIDEYPERPGQAVCQYFTRNGHCKFKSACKFHHPKTVNRVNLPM